MKKTILLTQNGLSGTVSKWLFVIFGLSNSINGVRNLTETPLTNWGLGLGILLLASGLLMATLGLILFNPTNMFAPKFVIDDNQIQIREDVHVKTKTINWNDIKEITYKIFCIGLLIKRQLKQINHSSDKWRDISRDKEVNPRNCGQEINKYYWGSTHQMPTASLRYGRAIS